MIAFLLDVIFANIGKGHVKALMLMARTGQARRGPDQATLGRHGPGRMDGSAKASRMAHGLWRSTASGSSSSAQGSGWRTAPPDMPVLTQAPHRR